MFRSTELPPAETAAATECEVALRDSEANIRALFNASDESIFLLAADGTLLDLNDTAARRMGRARRDLIGRPALDLLPPEVAARRRPFIERVLRTGKPVSFEAEREGRWMINHIQPIRGADGAVARLAVFSRDITERKQAEEELRNEHRRLAWIIEGTLVGTWEWNVQTGQTVFNERWAEMLGYTLAELSPVGIGTWEALTHPDDLPRARVALQRHFAGELPHYDCEFRMKHKAGHWVLVHDRGRLFTRTEDGRPLMMFGTHTDMTERKHAEELQRQLQKAQSLGRMAGAVAHRFNNHLQVVMGYLERAIEDAPGGAQGRRLDEAMKAARTAAEVSGALLTYLGQSRGRHQPLDLAATCAAGLSALIAELPQGAVVESDLPARGPRVAGDAGLIRQVLAALVTNAQEALPQGRGNIRVSIATVPAAEIATDRRFPIDWLPKDEAYACLAVADQGCGMCPEDMRNLFDPFFSTKFTGRGLGLAVVLGIVRAHGGAITVQSQAGAGSLFQVYLPLLA